MLRSEVSWFQRFIKIGRFYFQFTDELDEDGLQDIDYDVMKQVLQCQGKREVWAIVNAYNATERIQVCQELDQGLVAWERKYDLTGLTDYG